MAGRLIEPLFVGVSEVVPERTILFLISMLLCGAVAAQGVPQLASDDRSKAAPQRSSPLSSLAARPEQPLSLRITRSAVGLGSYRKPATMMSVFWRFNDGVLLQQHHQNS